MIAASTVRCSTNDSSPQGYDAPRASGVSDFRALRTSACARRSRGPLYSRRARPPSPRNRGRASLSLDGVCLDSVLQWWFRLLQVFPVEDSEPGSVFGLITGDPDPVPPSRDRAVPVCNSEL